MSNEQFGQHSVEKIGGTSMSRYQEVLDNVIIGERRGDELYQRIFVVSAYAGITNMLLEHKKTGEPGVFALFASSALDWSWGEALTAVHQRMCEINAEIFSDGFDRQGADQFITERIEGVRSCLLDLQRLCSYGHFRIEEHLNTVREMLSAIGEAHSAYNLALLLKKHDVKARFVDLTGWRGDEHLTLDERIEQFLQGIDLSRELPIVTGYAHGKGGMMCFYDRGYSEITFSRIAVVSRAREAIIHKEYHLSSADPNIVGEEQVVPIGRTNYDVADHLSVLGMEAIHPKAAKGLRQLDIPLRIKNTFEPGHTGTLISKDYKSSEPCVEIIAGRRGVYAIEVFDQDMLGDAEYKPQVLQVIRQHKLEVVSQQTSANSITVAVGGSLKRIKRVVNSLKEQLPCARVDTSKVSLVSVIGSDMQVPGILADAIGSLSKEGISILALNQSMRQVEIQFLVSENDYHIAIKVLHQRLVEVHDHQEAICAA